MFKKLYGLCVLMFLVLMAFALPAMANNTGGAPPGDIVAMINMDDVTGVIASMKSDTMIKYDLPAPSNYEKGSAISPIACGNNVLRHGHPGGVSMALT